MKEINFAAELAMISKQSQEKNDENFVNGCIVKIKDKAMLEAKKGKNEVCYDLNDNELRLKNSIMNSVHAIGLKCSYIHRDEDLNEPMSYSSDFLKISW